MLSSLLFSSKLIATMVLKNRSPRFQNYFVLSHVGLRTILKLAVLGIMAETRHNTLTCTSARVAALFWVLGIQKMYQEFEPCRNKLLSISISICVSCIQSITTENLATRLEYAGLKKLNTPEQLNCILHGWSPPLPGVALTKAVKPESWFASPNSEHCRFPVHV